MKVADAEDAPAKTPRADPFGILRRRYAAGEITTEDYEGRKSRIERDLHDPKLPLSGIVSGQTAG